MTKHVSVFNKEAVDLLQVNKGVYVDVTLGAAGHSKQILKNLESGTLYSFDLDIDAIKNFSEYLLSHGFSIQNESDKTTEFINKEKKVVLINDNFEKIEEYVTEKTNGILADLGWSTDQLQQIEGLSFNNPSDSLDMRFDKNDSVKASDLLNILSKKQLKQLFEEYADIYGKANAQLVSSILSTRKNKAILTVADLNQVIDSHLPANNRGDSLKPRVFQALRISVNRELSILSNIIPILFNNLGSGRLLIITFHSGEEEIVLSEFESLKKAGRCEIITKSMHGPFLRPSVDELKLNMSARSAKLFGIQKYEQST